MKHRSYCKILWTILILTLSTGTALAWGEENDTPLLAVRATALGFEISQRQAGLSGSIQSLIRTGDETHSQVDLQLAFDAVGKPVLARLSALIRHTGDGDNFLSVATSLLPLLQPGASGFGQTTLPAPPGPVPLPVTGGRDGTVQYLSSDVPATKDVPIAILDLPVTAPIAERQDGDSLRAAISDATLHFQNGTDRYHAPTGRFGGSDGSGSWTIDDAGHYCIERAPIAGLHCATVYKGGKDHFLLVTTGGPDSQTPRLAEARLVFGNPGNFTAPRRSDAAQKPVTHMIIVGNTEERRDAEGVLQERLYLDPNGTYRGMRADMPDRGTWSILMDGRRCLIPDKGPFECAFLSETDGGTFRQYDAKGQYLGEALYTPGNPEGF